MEIGNWRGRNGVIVQLILLTGEGTLNLRSLRCTWSLSFTLVRSVLVRSWVESAQVRVQNYVSWDTQTQEMSSLALELNKIHFRTWR